MKIILFFFLCASALAAPTVTPAEATAHADQLVTVKGTLDSIRVSKDQITFLNFGGFYPDQIFTGIIPADHAAAFPNLSDFTGKIVCVTGVVMLYHGKPQIILTESSQLALPPETTAKKLKKLIHLDR